jgi:DNA-binding transcriptional MerR regulator
MIKPNSIPISAASGSRSGSREIQLFEPPVDAVYSIEATSRIVDVPRRTILVYCKHQLLSPAMDSANHGYSFDRHAIHALRRIEALRSVCGDDFAGIKIILDLTAALERLRSDLQLLSRAKNSGAARKNSRGASSISSEKGNVKLNSRRKRK